MRRLPLLLQTAVVLLAVIAALVQIPASSIERWFSTGIYPVIQRQLTPLSNALPVAWLDIFTVAACAAVITILVRAGKRVRRTRRVASLLPAARLLAVLGASVYVVFLLLWGLNYRRVPMTSRLVVESGVPAAVAVAALGEEATRQLNALHDAAHKEGWRTPPLDDARLREAFVRVQRILSDAPVAAPGRLKATLFGPYFRWTGVDGMINPFGLEVLANPDLLPFERPFVAAHEWSHLAGYADEAEANFVGWLTCMQADVPSQYSGWLFLYWQVSSEVDRDTQARLGGMLAPGPRQDLNAIIERLQRGQRPWVRMAGWRLYDQYLKANRVEEGVRSYGAVVTLIARARFEPGWIPIRRP